MQPARALLAFCGLVLNATEVPSPDVCYQIFNSCVKPGFPKTIKTNDPGVLKAARHSIERFNNYTNDIFLFKESHISKALVQIVKGLKYMLNMEIGRTTCKKTKHPSLDNCEFQTNHTLKRVRQRSLTSSVRKTHTRTHTCTHRHSPQAAILETLQSFMRVASVRWVASVTCSTILMFFFVSDSQLLL
ncbi:cystatin-F isoform X1 [Pteropus vampyrus]|uniref:Cystatin-F isoform X1 n=1 Tax=Pteropus vampyrus TaxID=132908 RepID=A0A6P6BS32_PTEVA|nr:cystatin-F isoform X1 [Pteropus vampyrus]